MTIPVKLILLFLLTIMPALASKRGGSGPSFGGRARFSQTKTRNIRQPRSGNPRNALKIHAPKVKQSKTPRWP